MRFVELRRPLIEATTSYRERYLRRRYRRMTFESEARVVCTSHAVLQMQLRQLSPSFVLPLDYHQPNVSVLASFLRLDAAGASALARRFATSWNVSTRKTSSEQEEYMQMLCPSL